MLKLFLTPSFVTFSLTPALCQTSSASSPPTHEWIPITAVAALTLSLVNTCIAILNYVEQRRDKTRQTKKEESSERANRAAGLNAALQFNQQLAFLDQFPGDMGKIYTVHWVSALTGLSNNREFQYLRPPEITSGLKVATPEFKSALRQLLEARNRANQDPMPADVITSAVDAVGHLRRLREELRQEIASAQGTTTWYGD
ncbi:hypothetical protein [Bradyrhizobium sp. BR 10289]|uniref:hypothetical protein n=1 Tax=Bradyrhizobium sp. BR 10289 TaxID=2749993 RepID=UPI001C65225E|nr:hypothetical protein [Bradyrhizobium sp. BR 10289]MBW7968130.1 hypothetical protein [Bradyrhizobium sp. BR 10289]